MMSNQENNSLKRITIALGVLFAATLIFSIALFVDKQNTEAALTEEKAIVIEDLNSLKSDYENVTSQNASVNQELAAAKAEITAFIDSVTVLNADIASLRKYRNQVYRLRKERTALLEQVATLTANNAKLTEERNKTFEALEAQTAENQTLVAQNTKLADAVERGSSLILESFSVQAVKERNSGKFTDTKRARRADAFKVCYTVGKNVLTTAGDTNFYIEVLDPQGNVMGDAQTVSVDSGATLNYSKSTEFLYENASIDVCDYVSAEGDFAKGNYMVNVYDANLQLLGTSTFTLK
ncbi:MAG: hypothetical protein P8O88_04555 [Flavobacteriaceae bacterium]|nr:hypothetical protein [Flavobacteriaceae bacterium]